MVIGTALAAGVGVAAAIVYGSDPAPAATAGVAAAIVGGCANLATIWQVCSARSESSTPPPPPPPAPPATPPGHAATAAPATPVEQDRARLVQVTIKW